MSKYLFLSVFFFAFTANAQFLAPFQSLQNQPKIQFDYWLYSTHAGNGSTSQYPTVPTNKTDMDKIFNTVNTNSTLIRSGRTNSTKIIDWQSSTE